ncbi:MAG: hypothetical protein ABI655_15445 [Phenylobacterium sp.]
MRAAGLALALAATLAAPGLAQAKDSAVDRKAEAFQAVLDCRALADGAARLACYDAAAARMGEAEKRGDIVVIDRAQASAAHRQAFGLTLPSLDFVTRALKPEEVDALEGVVRAARADVNGRWTFNLEDGAQWRQISGDLMRPPRSGSKVRIRRGSLGSFLMNVDGQAAIKVHRDQ